MNTNFKVIGLTRLGMKLESTAPETDALTTRPSELLKEYMHLRLGTCVDVKSYLTLVWFETGWCWRPPVFTYRKYVRLVSKAVNRLANNTRKETRKSLVWCFPTKLSISFNFRIKQLYSFFMLTFLHFQKFISAENMQPENLKTLFNYLTFQDANNPI